jgi:signal transduction histidine kinase
MSEAKKFSILIVDDTPKNIQVVASILKELGYQVAFARDGQTALSTAKSAKFDLILLDIMMPEMDGYEVCQHLKTDSRTADIPIIFLTAKTESDNIVKGFEVGGVDYVTKPFNSAELVARVKTHLELRQAREALKKSEQQLRELNAAKDKFFSIIAHDLKNPFAALLGCADLLVQSEPLTEDQKDLAETINMASQQAYDLLQNLLKWSRSQLGHLSCEPESFDICAAVNKTMLLLKNNADNKNIRLISEIEENTLVFADPDMTITIVRNLISNAVKYTSSGGSITVSAKDQGNAWEISVSDTGVGITPEDIKKLFRIDVKHSTHGTAKEEGTGLGLNLCKEFAEKSGGKIGVQSEVGKGSRFYFTLPKPAI